MKRMTAQATGAANRSATQETEQFRKLVERKITAEQYVRDLERRTSEQREGATPRRSSGS